MTSRSLVVQPLLISLCVLGPPTSTSKRHERVNELNKLNEVNTRMNASACESESENENEREKQNTVPQQFVARLYIR